ncbi:MAG: hypothetical protein H6734_26850 [Alphaproteobacteria bacterium]|nr:hypothetical protein [Alphaproteobacteria bacterium]
MWLVLLALVVRELVTGAVGLARVGVLLALAGSDPVVVGTVSAVLPVAGTLVTGLALAWVVLRGEVPPVAVHPAVLAGALLALFVGRGAQVAASVGHALAISSLPYDQVQTVITTSSAGYYAAATLDGFVLAALLVVGWIRARAGLPLPHTAVPE